MSNTSKNARRVYRFSMSCLDGILFRSVGQRKRGLIDIDGVKRGGTSSGVQLIRTATGLISCFSCFLCLLHPNIPVATG